MMRKSLPAIFILVAIGLFYTFIDPVYSDVKSLKVDEAQFDEALERSREFLALRDELLTRYNGFPSDDLERLRKLLPDNIDNVRLILDLDGIASAYNMRLQNIAVTQDTGRGSASLGPRTASFGSVRLSFTVAATYETLLAFLADLERSLRVVDVVDLGFSESEGDLSEYTIQLETYWLP